MPAAGKRLYNVVHARRITGRDHLADAVGGQRVAGPIAHPPAGALHHRHQCREIMELEPGFDDDVEMAARQAAVIIAIAAEHHRPCLRVEMFEAVELAVVRFIDANIQKLTVVAGIIVALSAVAVIAATVLHAF